MSLNTAEIKQKGFIPGGGLQKSHGTGVASLRRFYEVGRLLYIDRSRLNRRLFFLRRRWVGT